MKKLSDKIHYQFVSGKINSAIYNYIQKIASNVNDVDSLIFDVHIKNMTKLGIKSENECQEYFRIISNAPRITDTILQYHISEEDANKLCKYAFIYKDKYNFNIKSNFIRLALDFIKDNNILIKKSYPNNMGIDGEINIRSPYNIEKWIETLRYIYNTANTNNLLLDKVAQQVIAKWNKDEQVHFQNWMRYYQEGNHSKYNVKTAQFFTNKQVSEQAPDLKPVKNMFDTSAFPKPDPAAEKQKRLDEWRKKLRGRLKSVEELVEQYRDVIPKDIGAIIRKDVYELKERVYGLELKASIVDSIMRTSNALNKRGFIEGANELKKIAQEVATDKLPEIPAIKEEVVPVPIKTDDGREQVEEAKSNEISSIPDVDATRSNIEVPNFNNITYAEAIKKLEEINSVVSERAIVRALAGVDIILSQLGIASFFVELTESQSKLLDAFNYSSTRISNVISQLRGRRLEDVKQENKKEEIPKAEVVETAEELDKPIKEVSTKLPLPQPIK
jgi:hypothetical protein